MSKYNYPTYKIIIAPDSHKTQGLQGGDVVRRQYRDGNNLIYSLMIVLESGTDVVGEKESSYFIGALVEGDAPQNGEFLDFVRVTNLFNPERGGALYLTASDAASPYLDVIDGMATEHSLYRLEKNRRICAGEVYEFPIIGRVSYPERVVISYRIRASRPLEDVPLTFGYVDGGETDGTDTVDVSTDWEYKLTLITVDYPPEYARRVIIAPILSGEEWCEVSDLNIVRLSSIAGFSDSTKARVGKISGIIDPVFGILDGYGAYFQSLYATRNVNIAGTLTAGDESGFASTFYVGKIHKNVIPDSVGCCFSGGVAVEGNSPAGIGRVVRVDGATELAVQSVEWRCEHIGHKYNFSIWIKSDGGTLSFYQDEHFIREVEAETAGEWRRYKVAFTIEASERSTFTIGLKSAVGGILLTAPQLESGERISQYQPTDGKLSYTEDYGAWFCKGGIGGTIQNPLLRLTEDGSICSRDGSFVILPDGTGHFAGGKFKWTHDDIELTDMTIRWGQLDEEARNEIISQAPAGKDANLLDWVSDWNSGKTVIEGQSVITPKIFAGTQNSNGTITGTALGRFSLSTRNGSGVVSKETVNGVYGFSEGKKTFALDARGNVELGNGDESIKYNVLTGKVEFGSSVSLNWVGATYIDSSGIFTGRLSAHTVNAVRLDASQITAGTISAARLDVDGLKASLITAGNIEALTLDVVRGKVGGWSLDVDSIYRGTKNNSPGGYTCASGSVTIGSAGIRGLKWRLDADGGGAIAGSNIVWDATGNVSFSPAVSLLWTDAAVDAANSGKLYVRGTGLNHAASRQVSVNGQVVHESSLRGLTLTVIARDTLVVNSTTNYDVYGSDTNCNTLATALNAVGSDKIVILTSYDAIRINSTLNRAIQRCGGSDCLIMDARHPFAFVGVPGIGKNNGLFALHGLEASDPYAELSTLVVNGVPQGVSVNGQRNTFINGSGLYTGTLNANQISAGTIDTSRLNTTELKAALITAANIQALTLDVTQGTIGGWAINGSSLSGGQIVLDKANRRIAVFGGSSSATSGHRVQLYYSSDADFGLYASDSGGTTVAQIGSTNQIAGWIFDNAHIYKNSVYLGSDGSLYNGMKWRLNNDGSGRIANGNILWDALGNVSFGDSVSLKWKNDIEAAKTANYGYRYYKRIVINGESGKYYPVVFKGGDQSHKRTIFIRRDHTEQAPSDWDNNSSTHMGSLILSIMVNFGGWGGTSYSWDIYELSECYSRMFAGAVHCGNSCMFAVFLRGGGTTGAVYHIYSDQAIESSAFSPAPIPSAPHIAYASDLIFQFEEHQAYAPSPRTLTESVEEDIRRHRFIALAQGNDSTLSAHPLTYISSTGIYTGTLTANQINAGTISAERIAAGSIHASKLDAASIRSDIINTNYINGLSCTFVSGSIGGWVIGSNYISTGSVGSIGATPIQLRTSETGSGYWYSGDYRPFGITMTWHQGDNAGHIVFGQIALSGNEVKRGFIGIQMMSWDNEEYFCLSTNYTRSGSKEVYNRIAGWAFDHTHIWKNNISLGSDGSISNGSCWQFNNDGSGRVANGNISWNASGAVSFGSSVSVQWTSGITTAQELASAMAFGKMLYRDPTFYNGNNSINVYNNYNNGTVGISRVSDGTAPNDSKYVLKVVNTGSASPGCGGFYFASMCSYRKVFVTRIIAKIPSGRTLQWASNSIGTNGWSKWLTSNAGTGDWCEYVYKVVCGTGSFSSTNYFYIEGSATLTWYVAYATVFDVTSTEKYTTTIDANGIYTSTLNASQITAGTISADRIAAGSITSAKLDAASIRANIINAGYINGLTCTFVRGSIGGWNINSSQIYKNSVALSSDGSITNGTKWRLNNDGSGYIANQNIRWDANGNVTMTGTINAYAGTIGGFTIAQGRIGSTATGSGSGGGLAIYNDLFRVGNTTSYVLLGSNTFPASSGGTCATGRIVNGTYNSYLNNYGLYVDVRNGYRNYGVWSNASIVGPACIGNKIRNIFFTGSGYSIDFSQFNIFFVYADKTYNVNLPSASSVASMFGYSSLPSDFAIVITFIYNYNWGGHINIMSVRNENGGVSNYGMERGDSLTLLCSNYPSFHYQLLNRSS